MVWKAAEQKGESLVEVPPLPFGERPNVLVVQGETLLLQSSETGETLNALEHAAKITTMCLNPQNEEQVFSASVDGNVHLWNVNEATLVEKKHFKHAIRRMILDATRMRVYVYANDMIQWFEWEQPSSSSSSSTKQSEKTQLSPVDRTKGCASHTYCLTEDGRFLIASKDKQFMVIDIKNNHQLVHQVTTQYPIASLCIDHMAQERLAVGDSRGSVHIYYSLFSDTTTTPQQQQQQESLSSQQNGDSSSNAFSKKKKNNNKTSTSTSSSSYVCRSWKWHRHPVEGLSFSPDGSFLYSTSRMGVVVGWNTLTNQKVFINMEGPIRHLGVTRDGRSLLVSLYTNIVYLINSSSRQTVGRVIGLQRDTESSSSSSSVGNSIQFHPRDRYLVFPVRTSGALQFFDLQRNRPVRSFRVVHHLKNSSEKSNLNLPHFGFSHDGSATAIVTAWHHPETRNVETHLRFYSFGDESVPVTHIEDPHKGGVQLLAFHPFLNWVLTCGVHGDFKLWTEVVTKKVESSSTIVEEVVVEDPVDMENAAKNRFPPKAIRKAVWECRATGEYKKFQAKAAGFSQDGSLMGIAYGPIVTLWSPSRNELRHELVHPMNETVEQMGFIPHSPYLVTTTSSHLYVWNLVTASIMWSYKASIKHLAVDQHSQHNQRFVVVVRSSSSNNKKENNQNKEKEGEEKELIVLFHSSSPQPLCVWTHSLSSSSSSPIAGLAFTSLKHNSGSRFRVQSMIGYMTENQDVFAISEIELTRNDPHLVTDVSQSHAAAMKKRDAHATDEYVNSLLGSIMGVTQTVAKSHDDVMNDHDDSDHDDDDHKMDIDSSSSSSSSSLLLLPESSMRKGLEVLCGTPSHVLPPLHALYDSFMDALVIRSSAHVDQQQQGGSSSSSSSVSSSSGGVVLSHSLKKSSSNAAAAANDANKKASALDQEEELLENNKDVYQSFISFFNSFSFQEKPQQQKASVSSSSSAKKQKKSTTIDNTPSTNDSPFIVNDSDQERVAKKRGAADHDAPQSVMEKNPSSSSSSSSSSSMVVDSTPKKKKEDVTSSSTPAAAAAKSTSKSKTPASTASKKNNNKKMTMDNGEEEEEEEPLVLNHKKHTTTTADAVEGTPAASTKKRPVSDVIVQESDTPATITTTTATSMKTPPTTKKSASAASASARKSTTITKQQQKKDDNNDDDDNNNNNNTTPIISRNAPSPAVVVPAAASTATATTTPMRSTRSSSSSSTVADTQQQQVVVTNISSQDVEMQDSNHEAPVEDEESSNNITTTVAADAAIQTPKNNNNNSSAKKKTPAAKAKSTATPRSRKQSKQIVVAEDDDDDEENPNGDAQHQKEDVAFVAPNPITPAANKRRRNTSDVLLAEAEKYLTPRGATTTTSTTVTTTASATTILNTVTPRSTRSSSRTKPADTPDPRNKKM